MKRQTAFDVLSLFQWKLIQQEQTKEIPGNILFYPAV
jgi:hypothetical protein